VHHVAIEAADLDVARAFYADLLGLSERSDRPTGIRAGHWFDAGDQQIHVVLPGGTGGHFAFEVDDIDACVAELRAKDADVPDPHGIGGLPRVKGEAVRPCSPIRSGTASS
jgi:glyoxylase I family protein